MTISEFNNKFEPFKEKDHYGLDIDIPSVIDYLNVEFEKLIKIPNFSYSQIKLKFNMSRFYCEPDSINSSEIERNINKLVKEYDEQARNLSEKT